MQMRLLLPPPRHPSRKTPSCISSLLQPHQGSLGSPPGNVLAARQGPVFLSGVFGTAASDPESMDSAPGVWEGSSDALRGNVLTARLSPVFSPGMFRTEASDPECIESKPVQRKASRSPGDLSAAEVHRAAERGMRGPGVPLPHLDAVQRAFGRHDVRSIRAHTGREAAEGARAMGALAFTRGHEVAFAERSPDLRTVAHEAAHVVQQAGDMPLPSGVGQAGDVHEQHADAVAAGVTLGRSVEGLLDQYVRNPHPAANPTEGAAPAAPVVQRQIMVGDREVVNGDEFRDTKEKLWGEALTRCLPANNLKDGYAKVQFKDEQEFKDYCAGKPSNVGYIAGTINAWVRLHDAELYVLGETHGALDGNMDQFFYATKLTDYMAEGLGSVLIRAEEADAKKQIIKKYGDGRPTAEEAMATELQESGAQTANVGRHAESEIGRLRFYLEHAVVKTISDPNSDLGRAFNLAHRLITYMAHLESKGSSADSVQALKTTAQSYDPKKPPAEQEAIAEQFRSQFVEYARAQAVAAFNSLNSDDQKFFIEKRAITEGNWDVIKMKDAHKSDEEIAAAMQGSQWSVSDQYRAEAAREMYMFRRILKAKELGLRFFFIGDVHRRALAPVLRAKNIKVQQITDYITEARKRAWPQQQ